MNTSPVADNVEYCTWYGVVNVASAWNAHMALYQPYLLRESTWQLPMYSLDKTVSSSILLLTFISKKTSREALTFVSNYLIDYLKIT